MGLRANVVCSGVWYKHPLSTQQHNFPLKKKTEKHSTLVVSITRWGLHIWKLADMIMTPWQPGELRWSVMAALELITTFWTFSLQHFNVETTNSFSLGCQGSGLTAWESDVKLVWWNICETYSDFRQIWQGELDAPLPWHTAKGSLSCCCTAHCQMMGVISPHRLEEEKWGYFFKKLAHSINSAVELQWRHNELQARMF